MELVVVQLEGRLGTNRRKAFFHKPYSKPGFEEVSTNSVLQPDSFRSF